MVRTDFDDVVKCYRNHSTSNNTGEGFPPNRSQILRYLRLKFSISFEYLNVYVFPGGLRGIGVKYL